MNRLPSPYNRNQEFSTAPQFRNPAQTNPLPQPANMPVACWFGTRQILNGWQDASALDYDKVMYWQSPIFDLQPQLRGLQPNGASGTATNNGLNTVPIWGNGTLHVQISNLKADKESLFNIILNTVELAHISDSGRIVQVLPESDITNQIAKDTDSIILNFSPYGGGSNIRYWQLRLQFIRIRDTSPSSSPPTYFLDSGYY